MGDWIRQFIEDSGYLGIFLLMLAETVFPPIPSEVIMSLAGLQAARGTMSLPLAIFAGAGGAMLGNLFWYGFARALGLDRFRPLVDRFGRWLTLDWKEVERADRFFDRYDRWFVFLGRMLPTIRSLVSIPAGLFGMRLLPFLFWSMLGTLGWTTGLAIAGYQLGKRFADIERYLGPISSLLIAGLLLWYVFRVCTWRGKNPDNS